MEVSGSVESGGRGNTHINQKHIKRSAFGIKLALSAPYDTIWV